MGRVLPVWWTGALRWDHSQLVSRRYSLARSLAELLRINHLAPPSLEPLRRSTWTCTMKGTLMREGQRQLGRVFSIIHLFVVKIFWPPFPKLPCTGQVIRRE
jgi:hypothetical protein